MAQSIQKFALIIGALVLAVLGYFVFVQGDDYALSPDAGSPLSDLVLAKTQAFIAHRAALDTVTISSEIFSDPRFNTLRSFTPPLEEQPIGRDNLFIQGVGTDTSTGAE